MFWRGFGREPRADELERWRRAVDDFATLQRKQLPASPEAVMQSREVWTDIAHAVFNTKEFIYVQ